MKLQYQIKSIITALLILFLTNACTDKTDTSNANKKTIVIANAGFLTPESVEYYAAEDVYLVTNINGDPFAADGNGFISKLKPDGSVIDLKWIDGNDKAINLNAPKGATILGNHLFVTDINQVHIFELPEGKQTASISIKESSFLNGITAGAGEFVYVTDSGLAAGFTASGTDAVYKVSTNGNYQSIFTDNTQGHPNGIVTDGEDLVVVTFGSGKIFKVDSSGHQTEMPSPPKGGLDGLLKLEDGRFLLSSWGGSAIYALNQDKTFSVLADSLDAPADLGFDSKRKRVLIPLFKQNTVVLLPL